MDQDVGGSSPLTSTPVLAVARHRHARSRCGAQRLASTDLSGAVVPDGRRMSRGSGATAPVVDVWIGGTGTMPGTWLTGATGVPIVQLFLVGPGGRRAWSESDFRSPECARRQRSRRVTRAAIRKVLSTDPSVPQSPVVGSITAVTIEMRLAGKPPHRACSWMMSSSLAA